MNSRISTPRLWVLLVGFLDLIDIEHNLFYNLGIYYFMHCWDGVNPLILVRYVCGIKSTVSRCICVNLLQWTELNPSWSRQSLLKFHVLIECIIDLSNLCILLKPMLNFLFCIHDSRLFVRAYARYHSSITCCFWL